MSSCGCSVQGGWKEGGRAGTSPACIAQSNGKVQQGIVSPLETTRPKCSLKKALTLHLNICIEWSKVVKISLLAFLLLSTDKHL